MRRIAAAFAGYKPPRAKAKRMTEQPSDFGELLAIGRKVEKL